MWIAMSFALPSHRKIYSQIFYDYHRTSCNLYHAITVQMKANERTKLAENSASWQAGRQQASIISRWPSQIEISSAHIAHTIS